jgi:hypothetical protein
MNFKELFGGVLVGVALVLLFILGSETAPGGIAFLLAGRKGSLRPVNR